MPEVKELISLVDYSLSGPALPAGHPFVDVQSTLYWSATTDAGTPTNAWFVDFVNGSANPTEKTNSHLAWCVR